MSFKARFSESYTVKNRELRYSFVGVLSVVMNKVSQGCLNFLKGVPLLPSITSLGCFITPLTVVGEEK